MRVAHVGGEISQTKPFHVPAGEGGGLKGLSALVAYPTNAEGRGCQVDVAGVEGGVQVHLYVVNEL